MSTDPPPPELVLAINDHGLLLGLDDTGAWVVWSPNHPPTSAHDRLDWLLPLLERNPDEIAATLDGHVTPGPLPDLVRYALTAHGSHWPGQALGWLEAGWAHHRRARRPVHDEGQPQAGPTIAPPGTPALERRQDETKIEPGRGNDAAVMIQLPHQPRGPVRPL